MSGKGISKGLARVGKYDPWLYGPKCFGKILGHRRYSKKIAQDELKDIQNDSE